MGAITTRDFACNAITMLAAEHTETGHAEAGIRERLESIAEHGSISAGELRQLILGGWEEGTVCHFAFGSKDLQDLARLILAADRLGLTRDEIRSSSVGARLEELGLLPVELEVEPNWERVAS